MTDAEWKKSNSEICQVLRQVHDAIALSSLPPTKKWVGLTKEEITHIGLNCYSLQQTADAIEAKLKEKNNDK